MTLPPFDLGPLPGEWWVADCSEAKNLERELRREVPKGHILYRVSVRAVAVRRHLKDVVFWLPGIERWAYVHLTWSAEKDPRWPDTICTPEWDEVVALFDEV